MIRYIKNRLHLINAFLACIWYGFPGRKLTVIGVTGTDGKTTTTHLTYEILKAAGKRVSMVSSVFGLIAGKEHDTGFHVTTPSPWFLQRSMRNAVNHNDQYFVLEVTSHGLDQNRVWGIPFEIGILTNVTHEHLDYHGNYEKYVATKSKLLLRSKIAIINREDESYIHISMNRFIDTKKIKTYGLKKGDTNLKSFSFETPLPGDYNKLNCLAAATAARELRIADQDIRKGLMAFSGVKGRFETIKTKHGFDVIIDFAHTPNALVRVLSTIAGLSKGRVIHVFGSAGLRDVTKRPMMGAASAKYADITIITEEDYRTEDVNNIIQQIEEGYKETVKSMKTDKKQLFKIPKRQEAIDQAVLLADKGDIVVLTGKGHEKSLCRGKTEYPWSDHEGLNHALKRLK